VIGEKHSVWISFVVRKHSSAIRERRKMEGKKRREKISQDYTT